MRVCTRDVMVDVPLPLVAGEVMMALMCAGMNRMKEGGVVAERVALAQILRRSVYVCMDAVL